MMSGKVRTGIIGCGKVAHLHAHALQNLPESDFLAVYGRDFGKAAQFAAQYGVAPCAGIGEMAEKGTEAVIICTPHPTHAVLAIQAMQAGMHVLVEKPLAVSLEDCDAMISTAKQMDIIFGLVSQRRFYLPCQRIRQAIDQGKIGKPIIGTVNMLGWRDEAYYQMDAWRGTWQGEGGGVLVNQAAHQLDLLQWYMGPIAELFGFHANLNHPCIEVEDTAAAVIRFKNGGLGNIVTSNSVNPALYGKVHIHGDNGASVGVQTDGGAMFIAGISGISEPPANDLWTIPGEEQCMEIWNKSDADFFSHADPVFYYHERQDEDFLRAVLNHTRPSVPGEDGRKTVEIFTAIYRSNRDRISVRFPLQPE
jgi:UDP-N-acetyl-2-amino-2-deoxyglucuronate dehydrogenase